MIGKIFNERYKIKSELGQGGMGTVYRAHDEALNRDVAVKLMSNTKLGTEGRARLLNEAQTIAQLNHPNIVTVFDVGEFESFPYIVMELLEGGTLLDNKPTETEQYVDIARQICAALEHAHNHGIIHRDLKPENIALDAEGNLLLMDFGLARSVATRLTSDGGIVGTVYYMAPEQAMGKELDGRADLYALGVILYELTTGALPFEDIDPIAVISQHIYAPPIAASIKNSDIPPLLNDLIMRLLSKDPNDRPASADDVISILNDPDLLDKNAAAAPAYSLLDRIVRGRIVGRKSEFEEARSLWSKSSAGQGQLLLISGEPGVGKTRLMREIATHADVSGGRVLIGESFAQSNAPYSAFGQIVRTALNPSDKNSWELEDFILADLLTLAPELHQRYPDIAPNPALEPDAERQRLFENVTSFFATLAEQSPLLIVIDDAHWSDSGTLLLLHHLARRTTGLAIMFVVTYREVELIGKHPLNEMLLELNRQRLGTRVKLSRLGRQQTQSLLDAIFAEDVSEELAELIYRETEGNPFFVEEVCKALVESGVLYYQDGEWHRPDLDKIEVPQSIQVAIEARLAKLDNSFVDVLRMAATLGREFEYNTLVLASDLPEDQLEMALEAAEEAQLLAEVSGKAGGVFSFAHALIPASLISGLSGIRRRRLHRQALTAEEQLHPQDFASLAQHASESGDVEKTLMYCEKAGDAAASLYAWEEAQSQYQTAIEAAEDLDLPERLAELHLQAADARSNQGFIYQAIEHYFQVIEYSNDPATKTEAKTKIGTNYVFVGDERGYPMLMEARQELDPKTQALALGWTIVGIGRHHHMQGQHKKAIVAYQEAQKYSDVTKDINLQGGIYAMSAGAYQHLAEYEESNHWAQASVDLGQKHNNLIVEAIGHEFFGENYVNMGRCQDALDSGELEFEIARKIGDQNRVAWTLFYTAFAYHGLGLLSKSEQVYRDGYELAEMIGDRRLGVIILGLLTRVMADLGRFEEAEESGLRAVELGEQLGQIFMTGMSKIALAECHIKREQWTEAIELLSAVWDSHKGSDARWFPMYGLPSLAEAYFGIGDLDMAGKLAEESYQAAIASKAIAVQSNAQRIIAQVFFAQEKYDDALEQVNAAIALAQPENYRLGLGRAYFWKAKILAAQGDAKAAKEAASQAQEVFEFCGAAPDLERVGALEI